MNTIGKKTPFSWLRIPFYFLVSILCASNTLNSQSTSNQDIVQHIYNQFDNPKMAVLQIKQITPQINWSVQKNSNTNADRKSITFTDIMQNQWRQIEISHLQYQKINPKQVLISGIFSGRQATECDYISTPFKHLWTIENSTPIQFTELTAGQSEIFISETNTHKITNYKN